MNNSHSFRPEQALLNILIAAESMTGLSPRAKRPLGCKFKEGSSDKKEGASHRRDPFARKIKRVCYT